MTGINTEPSHRWVPADLRSRCVRLARTGGGTSLLGRVHFSSSSRNSFQEVAPFDQQRHGSGEDLLDDAAHLYVDRIGRGFAEIALLGNRVSGFVAACRQRGSWREIDGRGLIGVNYASGAGI